MARYKEVDVDDLHFDASNPRFAPPSGAKLTEDQIQSTLEKEPHIALELVDSFLENGFIDYEPLVVRRRKKGGGYLVVEGNRRLAAIRHIRANIGKYAGKSTKLDDLERIPVLIFPDSAQDQKLQRIYLGVRHLFGFKDWPPDSKAHFLDAMIKNGDDLLRTMRELNIKKQEISRYLVPLRLRKYAPALWEPHKDQDFWVLGEGLNRSGVREYIGLKIDPSSLQVNGVDKKKLRQLFTFIYGTLENDRKDRRINDTRELSKLARVLASKRASAVLEKGGTLEKAFVHLESDDEMLTRFTRLVSELKVVVNLLKKRQGGPVLAARFTVFEKHAKEFIKNA